MRVRAMSARLIVCEIQSDQSNDNPADDQYSTLRLKMLGPNKYLKTNFAKEN
jgi:hypothetical protein